MIPDERTCQYFITIAREKNISRAARSLYISQPSLSRFLTGLEKELGTPLFIRNNGILSPTPAGELFFQYIASLKGLESRFSNDLSSLLLPQKQTLRIGAGSITSPFLAEKVFPILHREYPDVELSLTEDIHIHLLSRMEKGELDLSVLVASGADVASNRFVKVLARAPRLFMISRSHPLASLVARPEKNSVENPRNFLFIIWKTRPWSPVFPVRKYVRISARSSRNTGLTTFRWFLFKTAKQISPWPNAVLPLLFSLLFM